MDLAAGPDARNFSRPSVWHPRFPVRCSRAMLTVCDIFLRPVLIGSLAVAYEQVVVSAVQVYCLNLSYACYIQ